MPGDLLADLPTDEELDLGSLTRDELKDATISDPLIVYLPLPSIGRSNSHIDICSDLIDASWVAESLARCVDRAEAENQYVKETQTSRVKLTLHGPWPPLGKALDDAILVFQGDDEEDENGAERYKELRELIADYEDDPGKENARLPEIIDWYYANLVGGANYEYQSEAPDFYADQIRKHPERQLGFFRSAYSGRLGAHIYASPDSWITPASVDPDRLFEVTGQRYRLAEFTTGEVFMLDGQSFVRAHGELVWFPMNQYFKSRVCVSLACQNKDDWPLDRFAWLDSTFTFSPYGEHLRLQMPDSIRAAEPRREGCLVHQSGSMLLISDGDYLHYLYDTKPLNQPESKRVHERVSELARTISASLGLSPSERCDWTSLDDDQFEQLCYDLISAHPKFDTDTIRKMGKSRSRDGGRDIVISEAQRFPGTVPRKWIFQCKLIRDGSSLTPAKLRDVGDMLEQYGANGFGVMTSAPIDATLYDRLDGICPKRGIEQMHLSVYELERRLASYPLIRLRYFPSK